MDFSEMLIYLKEGEKCSRHKWDNENFIYIAKDIAFNDLDGLTHITESKTIVFTGTFGAQVGWSASPSDLLANDWYIKEVI